jgi:hypothetical protein
MRFDVTVDTGIQEVGVLLLRSIVLLTAAACSSPGISGFSPTTVTTPAARPKPDYLIDPLGSLRFECEHNDGKACTWVGLSYEEGDVYPGSGVTERPC